MCGIAGIVRFDPSSSQPELSSQLAAMNAAMVHRGPDSNGIQTGQGWGIAMQRLAIIDPSGGDQPISDHHRGVHVVLNGEIYNYRELRAHLIGRGYRFQTQSDTEVLLNLYIEYGFEAINRLNGMYAFAIMDEKEQSLWLGRDRLGVKPLYYTRNQQRFMFASSLDCFTAVEDFKTDNEALLTFLGLSYIPGNQSKLEEVYKLPPACCLHLSPDQVRIHRYWDPLSQSALELNPPDLQQAIESTLQDSISLHMRSDVPIGCFLSGGIDSGTISAMFAEQYTQEVHTFSASFSGKGDDEIHLAEQVAHQYGTKHHSIYIDAEQALSTFDQALKYFDEPIADSALIPSFLLSQAARQEGIKVMLSGAGGDEVFGGYARHYRRLKDTATALLSLQRPHWISHKRMKRLGRLWQLCSKNIAFAASTSGVNMPVLAGFFKDEEPMLKVLATIESSFEVLERLEPEFGFSLSRMYTDLVNYLPDNVLALTDKASMGASLEARVPYLDHRLVELVFASNYSHSLRKDYSKYGLRDIAGKYLPIEITGAPKRGFNGPVESWLQHPAWQNRVDQVLETKHPLQEFLDFTAIKNAWQSKRPGMSETLFQLLVLQRTM